MLAATWEELCWGRPASPKSQMFYQDKSAHSGDGAKEVRRREDHGWWHDFFHGIQVPLVNKHGWRQVEVQRWWRQNNFVAHLASKTGHQMKKMLKLWKMPLRISQSTCWMIVDHLQINLNYQSKMRSSPSMRRSIHWLPAWWSQLLKRLPYLLHYHTNLHFNHSYHLIHYDNNPSNFNSTNKQQPLQQWTYTLTAQHTLVTRWYSSSSSFTDTATCHKQGGRQDLEHLPPKGD